MYFSSQLVGVGGGGNNSLPGEAALDDQGQFYKEESGEPLAASAHLSWRVDSPAVKDSSLAHQ